MNNLEKYSKILAKLGRLALGYERMLDLRYGYILALFHSKKISLKEKKALVKVYANWDNGNERWTIKKGKLVDNSSDPEWRQIYE